MNRDYSVVEHGELTDFLNRSWPGHDLFVAKMKDGEFEIRSWANRDKQESFTILPITTLNIGKAQIRQIEKMLGRRKN